MATETIPPSYGELRALGAAGGISASTTDAFQSITPGTRYLRLQAFNGSAATVVVQVATCPWLTILKTTDALAAIGNMTDYSNAAQDNDAATDVDLSSLDTAANDDYVYVGSHVPFSGVSIDVDATNSTSSVLTVNYWDGTDWSDISDTDGTIATGATMGQDGNVTWTIPSDWEFNDLVSIGDTTLTENIFKTPQYWTRWQVSAALDATTTQNSWLAMPREDVAAAIPAGLASGGGVGGTIEMGVHHGPGGIGGIRVGTPAGTALLAVTAGARTRFA